MGKHPVPGSDTSASSQAGGAVGDRGAIGDLFAAVPSKRDTAGAPVALRPVKRSDEALIEAWIKRPEIQRWWGNAASAFAEVRLAQESPSAICRIVLVDGKPAGYAHAIDAALWGDTLPEGLPAGTWDVDLFIAEPAARGRGAGEAALGMLIEDVFDTTMALAVCVFVSIRNEAAVRIYEKAGFHWVRIWEDPVFGPMWMMLRERESSRRE